MDSDSDDNLVLHTLLYAAQDVIRQRGETSHREKKHKKYINRDREATHELLVHRFRISRKLFLRIASDLERNYEFFQLRWDARGKRGFTTIQKCTAALRQLGYVCYKALP
uniref:Uncharacterized protein n=1 Tax=Lactuca sativa TaxID=4236 RepID=A0A9R1XE90_LACSA|nr:hypothetical protein LSAT_V11C500274670 [Lactuca sativa]